METVKFLLVKLEENATDVDVKYRDIPDEQVAQAVAELWEEQQELIKETQIYPPDGFYDIGNPAFYEKLSGVKSPLSSWEPRIQVREMREEGWLIINCFYSEEAQMAVQDRWLFCCRWIEEEQPGWNATRKYKFIPILKPFSVDPKDGTLLLYHEGNVYPYPPFQEPWPSVIYHPHQYVALGMLNKLLKPSNANPITILFRSGNPYKSLAKQLAEELRKVAKELVIPLDSED